MMLLMLKAVTTEARRGQMVEGLAILGVHAKPKDNFDRTTTYHFEP